ncbi:PREDICTED: uncharacterized protein LOC101296180 [Fragaria vesca subsp. vesca]
MHKWETLRNPTKHIERVISTHSSQEAANHRLRLIATIEGVRLLAKQGCAFRGNDESADSINRGNFDAVLSSFGRMNLEVQRVFDNAPGNAKYTSPLIQKQIANILGNKVREKIRDEVGSAKFCILVDEAVDASSKEQMAIILRFVDCHGFIRERFFKILSVADTCSQTFYSEISKVFTHNDLQIENMCGQGYDGASNMRGEFNDSSAKRHSALKATREEEIAELMAAGKLQTCTGANQACTLERKGVRACEQNITNEHYYRVNILNAVIDFQLAELDNRFPDDSLELLVLSATLDPRDNFVEFRSEDVCNLALKFYPEDFTSYDLSTLDMECGFFVADILVDPRFVNTSSVSDLFRCSWNGFGKGDRNGNDVIGLKEEELKLASFSK